MLHKHRFSNNSMDLPKWVPHGPIFRFVKDKVGDGRDRQRGKCKAAAVCHLGCSALPLHSGPSSSPTLGRTVAHQKRSTTIEHDQKRGRSKAIKKSASPHSGPIAAPPICSPEADNSHGCRLMVFISCRFEHDREDCPLRVHTCGPFSDEFFFFSKIEKPFFCHGIVQGGKKWSSSQNGQKPLPPNLACFVIKTRAKSKENWCNQFCQRFGSMLDYWPSPPLGPPFEVAYVSELAEFGWGTSVQSSRWCLKVNSKRQTSHVDHERRDTNLAKVSCCHPCLPYRSELFANSRIPKLILYEQKNVHVFDPCRSCLRINSVRIPARTQYFEAVTSFKF